MNIIGQYHCKYCGFTGPLTTIVVSEHKDCESEKRERDMARETSRETNNALPRYSATFGHLTKSEYGEAHNREEILAAIETLFGVKIVTPRAFDLFEECVMFYKNANVDDFIKDDSFFATETLREVEQEMRLR